MMYQITNNSSKMLFIELGLILSKIIIVEDVKSA